MRRLRYQVAVSLDGFIAGPDDDFSWIPDEPEIDFEALYAEFDTFLMGRRTWEVAGTMTGPGRTVVVSTTLDPAAHPAITVISGDVEARVAELKAEPGKDIWLFGGGQLFHGLLAAGLVDTMEPAIIPIVLGDGVPFLPSPSSRHDLELTGHRIFPGSGIALLEYTVRNTPTGG